MSDRTRNGIQSEPLPDFLTKEVAEMFSNASTNLTEFETKLNSK
ncbi:hypothetical protein [Bacillus cereus]|uniref:Uncharacterized protein n=1 Tax=Bacillus cereus HuA3-9 TaxID=1053205 RepID=R8CK57_BACCE|nr:hypothetical protein [Bacillus cereus]EOO11972.1 hypothetical protein IGA_05201 [Bacillus cereus HuA3-9]KZD26862.1 hypothetical protein B4083_5657 [Bacillus cereus]